MKSWRIVWLVIGGVPLVVYPFVAIASLMSLGAPTSGGSPALLTMVARSFQAGSLAYPLVYFPCLGAMLILKKKKKERAASLVSVIPLVFLALLVLLFGAWRSLDHP